MTNSALEIAAPEQEPLVAFPAGVAHSTPLNATPYLSDFPAFADRFGFGDDRRALVEGFRAAIVALGVQARPVFALIGGSILDVDNRSPKDLDGAIFYEQGDGGAVDAAELKRLAASWKANGLDLRPLPFDGPAAMSAKLVAYFAILYSQRRGPGPTPPVLIIDLQPATIDP